MSQLDKIQILQQIAAISDMERGKLSTYTFKNRPNAADYHKLQHWQDGRNQTRYIPAEDLPAVQAALEGYEQYRQLTGQYADLVIQETREKRCGSKKKKPHPISSSPRTRKSKV